MVLFGETMAMKADTPLTLTTTDDEDMMVEAAVDMDAFSAFTDVRDSQLAEAALNAVTSGKLTPLIKVELRSTIQAKRLSEGKEELEVEIESAIEDDVSKIGSPCHFTLNITVCRLFLVLTKPFHIVLTLGSENVN